MERGNDQMLREQVRHHGDVTAGAQDAADAASKEETRVEAMPPADDEPGEDHPEPEPPPDDGDSGFDPLPDV